jgi:hypothetical protein
MKIIVPGHRYEVPNMDDNSVNQVIQFIEKKPKDPDDSTLVTTIDGTSTEQVLRVLINRIEHLQKMIPCRENALVITKLEEAEMWLNARTFNRMKRRVEGTHQA